MRITTNNFIAASAAYFHVWKIGSARKSQINRAYAANLNEFIVAYIYTPRGCDAQKERVVKRSARRRYGNNESRCRGQVRSERSARGIRGSESSEMYSGEEKSADGGRCERGARSHERCRCVRVVVFLWRLEIVIDFRVGDVWDIEDFRGDWVDGREDSLFRVLSKTKEIEWFLFTWK